MGLGMEPYFAFSNSAIRPFPFKLLREPNGTYLGLMIKDLFLYSGERNAMKGVPIPKQGHFIETRIPGNISLYGNGIFYILGTTLC